MSYSQEPLAPPIPPPSPLEFESYNNSKLGRRLIVLLKPSVSDKVPSLMHRFTRVIPSRPVAILFDSWSLLWSPRNQFPTQAMPTNLLQPTGLKNIATYEFLKNAASSECWWVGSRPRARSHLHLVGPHSSHAFFTTWFFCPHMRGNSFSLGTNMLISSQKYKYSS